MTIVASLSSSLPLNYVIPLRLPTLKLKRNVPPFPHCPFVHFSNTGQVVFTTKYTPSNFGSKLQSGSLGFILRKCVNSINDDESFGDDWGSPEEDTEDTESPWVGAVVYQRNASVSHVEYCTTLERLGLGSLSTDVSRSRASLMGLRVTKSVKDYPLGTPVLISIDVTRKKKKLRLDGIIRTVLTLGCNRCGEPAAECVFSNFSLLLLEEPIEEPEVVNMGVIFGEDKFRASGQREEEEENDEAAIYLDDQLYFPPEQKEIDISKNIRDMVHVEITVNAICDPSCKGLCLKCGCNLNTSKCNCSKQATNEKRYGPLGGLKKQMQQS